MDVRRSGVEQYALSAPLKLLNRCAVNHLFNAECSLQRTGLLLLFVVSSFWRKQYALARSLVSDVCVSYSTTVCQ